MIDTFEKKSREGSAEPRARPAEPYNQSDEDDSREVSDEEKPFTKSGDEDEDEDDDDEIV